MSLGGWMIMILSVGGTTGALLWCIVRVLKIPKSTEKLHGQIELHTPDQDQ